MQKAQKRKNYYAYSLVEMLIAIVIIGFVIMLVAATMTAMVKASAISSARSLSRDETEFMLEVVRRTVRNSDPEKIFIYKSINSSPTPCRFVNSNGEIETSNVAGCDLNTIYTSLPAGNEGGNEIHLRPSGSERWICIAFFPDGADTSKGYIMKTSASDLVLPQDCFDKVKNPDYKKYTMFLNSNEIDVNLLDFKYFTSEENTLMTIDLEVEPVFWIASPGSDFKPEYRRQAIVSTGKINWAK